ncbi:MAG: CapA family protein [Deltaproteobacteria bacterium]|nr:CapA family protein [Deltaproteobacteria bacterium]
MRFAAALGAAAVLTVFAACFSADDDPAHGTTTVAFTGDTYLGESFDYFADVLKEKGYDDPFAKVDPFLASADLVITNFEAAITRRGDSPYDGIKPYVLRADPQRMPNALFRHGLRVVSLANNHTMDFGAPGLADTRRFLSDHGITYFGAGENRAEAGAPYVASLKSGDGERSLIVFSAFSRSDEYESYGYFAGDQTPGVNPLDTARLTADIRAYREADANAFIVVFPHWGGNYRWRSDRQLDQARVFMAAGADLVVGQGAHNLQEIDFDGRRPIVHNLGNFVFLPSWDYEAEGVPPYSLIAMLHFAGGVTLRLYPIYCDSKFDGNQPRPVTKTEFNEIVETLRDRTNNRTAYDDIVRTGRDALGYFLRLPISD